jgi:(R,R)-butanediol dehydrogenase / meso-butanediol dehydrogenase / diacetyl reductase
MIMRVAVLSDIKKLIIQERSKPKIAVGEVLVKIEYCGICGSDVHTYLNASFFPIGTVMGHEVSGVVVEIGTQVKHFKPGMRVVVKPVAPCRICEACKNGRDNVCYQGFDRDIGESPERDGGFSDFMRVPWPDEMLFSIPDKVSFQEAVLVEPLATSLHAMQQSEFKVGSCVIVSGAGAIGLGLLQLLRIGGAGKIIVLEISPERSSIAKTLGADYVFNPIVEGTELEDKIAELTGGFGADVLYECAGVPAALQNSIKYVRKGGGQIMVVGITDKDVPINPLMLVLKEIEMKGCIGYTSAEFQKAIDIVASKQMNTQVMISDTILLKDIEKKGFQRILSSTDMVKVLVHP